MYPRSHDTQQVLDAKEVVNKKRPDGSAIKIAECNVGDASGTIMFTARNKQGASPNGASRPLPRHPTHGPFSSHDDEARHSTYGKNKSIEAWMAGRLAAHDVTTSTEGKANFRLTPSVDKSFVSFSLSPRSGLDESWKHGDYSQRED